MNIVYFSHSYRKEDAQIVKYFGRLMRSENLIPSLDPPSESVNAAKLERHLNSSDGMVAVITKREGGVSPHILFEIVLCLRARKPVIVFVEDELSDKLVPARILQRRFSRRSYLRQVRQHRHGLQILKVYLGEQPPPRYQPSTSRRSCLLIGIEDLPKLKEVLPTVVESRGYSPVDLGHVRRTSPESLEIYEAIACADLALCLVDSKSPESQFLLGAVQATFIPSITFTADAAYSFHPQIPKEYQPRVISGADTPQVEQQLHTELELFEEDFVELDKQNEVEAYAGMLVDIASQRGNYDVGTRNFFVQELNMESKYKITGGNQGAVGDESVAHDFTQVSNQTLGSIDMTALATELSRLRAEARKDAVEPGHDIAVSELAKAEQAAKEGQASAVMQHLKSAGSWALDVATKIGTSVAVEAIKKSMAP
jgi:hypothetical protein